MNTNLIDKQIIKKIEKWIRNNDRLVIGIDGMPGVK